MMKMMIRLNTTINFLTGMITDYHHNHHRDHDDYFHDDDDDDEDDDDDDDDDTYDDDVIIMLIMIKDMNTKINLIYDLNDNVLLSYS